MTPRFTVSKRRVFYRLVLFLGDAACLAASLWAAYLVRFRWPLFTAWFPPQDGHWPEAAYRSFIPMAVTLVMAAFIQSGLYRRVHLPFMDEALRLFHAGAKGGLLVLAAIFFSRDTHSSRLVMAVGGVFSALSLLLWREAAKLLYRRVASLWWEPHRVLVLGTGRMAESVRRVLGRNPGMVPECRSVAGPAELRRLLAGSPVREVFSAEPSLDHVALMALSEACEEAGVPFKIIPDLMELRMGEIVFDDSLGLPSFAIRPASLRGSTYVYKRLFDVVLSTAIASALFFPFLFLAFLIRIDSRGPVFFRQWRVGLKGERFPFFKFRSMVTDAEERLTGLKALNERAGPVFKIKDDPRVTRVGRWIRKLSVDEFPQLLNVLRGEMSLVGPRPQLPAEVAEAGELAKRRMNVLPGITGLWQVSGRAQLTYEEMIELDTYYIEHWSPGLDLLILLRTLPAILKGEGAY